MNSFNRIVSYKNGWKNGLILVTLFLAMIMVSCGKLYVGRQVNSYTQHWCRVNTLPESCKLTDEWFIWKFTIEEGKMGNEYIIKGTADLSQGDVWSYNIISSTESKFFFVLSNDNVVVDSIVFRLVSDKVGKSISFKRTFVFEGPFDAISICWQALAKG
jgi:hypothetical protein